MSAVKQKQTQFVQELRAKKLRRKFQEQRMQMDSPQVGHSPEEQEEMCLTSKKRLGQMACISDTANFSDVHQFMVDTRDVIRRLENTSLRRLLASHFLSIGGPKVFSSLLQRFGGHVEMLRELTWILLLIFGGASDDQCVQMSMEGGFVLLYGRLMSFRDPDLMENVVWGLANLIFGSPQLKKAVCDSGLLDHINTEIEAVLNEASPEAQARGKPLDVAAAYNMLIWSLFMKDPALRLEDQREILGFLMYTIFGRFGGTYHTHRHLLEEFLEVLCNTMAYAQGTQYLFQSFFGGHPQFKNLMNELLEIVMREEVYLASKNTWSKACELLEQFIQKFDVNFTQQLLDGKLVQKLLGCLSCNAEMAEGATKCLLAVLKKELDWKHQTFGLQPNGVLEFFDGLLEALHRWGPKSETVKVHILEVFSELLTREQNNFERMCMEHPERFQPVYQLFDEKESQAVVLLAIKVVYYMVILEEESEFGDFAEDPRYKNYPCQRYISHNEHLVTQFVLDSRHNHQVSFKILELKQLLDI